MSKIQESNSYNEILESLKAAEKLEWEATLLGNDAHKRRNNLTYLASAHIVLLFIIIALSFEAFLSTIDSKFIVSELFTSGLSVLVIPIVALFPILLTLASKEKKHVDKLEKDSEFRLNLAIELIQPYRDLLYIKAENIHLSSQQLSSIKTRLYRFPIKASTERERL